MAYNFIIGQKIICTSLYNYEGDILVKGNQYTISLIGNNVFGFEEHSKEDGTPIKFFKHHFKEKNINIKRIFRKGDKISYEASNWTVKEQVGNSIVISYNGGGQDDKVIDILTSNYSVTSQRLYTNDRITLPALETIQRYIDGDYYYIGRVSVLARSLHKLYMQLEDKAFVTVSKSFDNGAYANIKNFDKNLFIPMEMAILLKEANKPKKIGIGSEVKFKKGRQLIIGKNYIVKEVVKLASKTILGLVIDNGIMYVNKKQCKIIKLKTTDEKKVVKEESENIF